MCPSIVMHAFDMVKKIYQSPNYFHNHLMTMHDHFDKHMNC